jgi:hypothetical protein
MATVVVTVFDLNGTEIIAEDTFDVSTAVKEIRTQVHTLKMSSLPEIQRLPWEPIIKTRVDLVHNDQLIDDSYLFQEQQAHVQALIQEYEEHREGKQLSDIYDTIEREAGKCLGLYVHGSWAYGYKNPDDVDMLAVVDPFTVQRAYRHTHQGGSCGYFDLKTCFGSVNICCIAADAFYAKVMSMDITLLTCLSLPERFVLRAWKDQRLDDIKIDVALLKRSIVAFSDYKWLSAVISGFGARSNGKEIYYAFRALQMGKQLASHGKIIDFEAGTDIYVRACLAFDVLTNAGLLANQTDTGRKWYSTPDMVQASFARAFQMLVHDFEATVDGRPGVAADEEDQLSVCDLCKGKIESDDIACELVNCKHSFHSICLATTIQLQYKDSGRLWYCDDRGSWLPCHPFGTCPVCQASVRLPIGDVRARNLLQILFDRPLEGTLSPPLVVYRTTINFHSLLSYICWNDAFEQGSLPVATPDVKAKFHMRGDLLLRHDQAVKDSSKFS